jgi:hypothetical protein
MKFRLASAVVLASAVASLASQPAAAPAPLVVHEWGTFTSIAGEEGQALQWLPNAGPSDLPCFVERSRYNIKGSLWGTVRMETPVLYFYAPTPIDVNVGVVFKEGAITEWYPHAQGADPRNGQDGWIRWANVRVTPGAAAEFPIEPGSSHYYAARDTDAAPIEVASQKERFLFYRGVGWFAPPLSATISANGEATVWSASNDPLGDVIVFDSHGGTIAYGVQHGAKGRITMARPAVDDDVTGLQRELVKILIANGLYAKEAEAMVATWTDSWFEEGTRIFYVVPRATVDAILPLSITPAPQRVERVFVGRLELASAASRAAVRDALKANDPAALAKYGRFLVPIGSQALKGVPPSELPQLEARLNAVVKSGWTAPQYCQ